MTREDALESLTAALDEAELRAAYDFGERDDQDPRRFHRFVAELLVRYVPAHGLSIRLDDGSEIPS